MLRRVTLISLGVVALSGAAALADEATCIKAIGKETGAYAKRRLKAISRCEDRRSAGALPLPTVCRPQCDSAAANAGAACLGNSDCPGGTCQAVSDATTATKLTSAAARATDRIATGCAGVSPLPAIGAVCDDSAASSATLAACITGALQDVNIEAINADTLARALYDSNAPVANAALLTCQRTVSKEIARYTNGRYTDLQSCHDRVARGVRTGPCPDAATRDRVEKRRARLVPKIKAKCSETALAANTPPKLDFGFPCEKYKDVTFKRDGITNNNLIPVQDRLIECLTDNASATADHLINIGYPGAEGSAFAQGVASGDVTDTAAIFWTRLPDPNQGALFDIADDRAFTNGLQTISVPAPGPSDDGTVKLEVTMLSPLTEYYYRFRQGSETSTTGRVKTAPPPTSSFRVRVGWTGDANAYFRPYTVLDPIRLQNPDAWFFIGDTIYGDDPRGDGVVASTLPDYQGKYRDNREDASLRNLMAETSTYTIWDDHEVRNDFAGQVPAFAAKMAAGNQAFRQYNPIRDNTGDPQQLYRSFKWGNLAEFFLIDLRQYRSAKYTCCSIGAESGFVLADSDTTCSTGELALPDAACNAGLATPGRTILGPAQLAWLQNGLSNSTSTFKFIMNGPPITNLFFQPYDFWIGYPEERNNLLSYILTNNIKNVIWLSTDLHGIVVSHDRVSIGPSQPVPEVVGGAIGMDSIFRLLPASIAGLLSTLPSLLTQITQFDIARFNAVMLTVDPGVTPRATLDFYDRSNAVVQQVVFDATP